MTTMQLHWNGNTHIQYIGEKSAILNWYITKYMLKIIIPMLHLWNLIHHHKINKCLHAFSMYLDTEMGVRNPKLLTIVQSRKNAGRVSLDFIIIDYIQILSYCQFILWPKYF